MPRDRRGDVHAQPRAGRACRSTREHLALAEPQAVVINSGVANAATGERGKLDALATAAEAARLLGLDAEEVLVLSTGVIGAPLPLHKLLARRSTPAVAALSADGGADAAEAIMTTDTRAEGGGRRARRLHGRRHGEGLRDDPPRPRDDARGRHDRLPARARRGDRVPAARGRDELQRDLGRRRVLDERQRDPARERRERRAARDDAAFAAALREVCAELARQIVADGEGVTVLAEIDVTGAVDDAQAKAIARRIATSPLVKTALFGHDANWGRVLDGRRLRAVQRRLRERRPRAASRSRYNGTVVLDARRADRTSSRTSRGPSCTIELDLGLGDGSARLPDERPLLRLRPHQRGLPDVSRIVVKVGGAVAAASAAAVLELAREQRGRASSTAPGRRSRAEMERARHPGRVRRRPARDDRRRRSRSCARRSPRSTRRSAPRSAPRAVPLFGDEIGLEAEPVPELGLVGDPMPCAPAGARDALDAGQIPVVAPLARRPAERQRRRGRRRARGRPRRRRGSSSSPTSPGCLLDGAVVDSHRRRDAPRSCSTSGTLEGGIVPKLGAAVTAARARRRAPRSAHDGGASR